MLVSLGTPETPGRKGDTFLGAEISGIVWADNMSSDWLMVANGYHQLNITDACSPKLALKSFSL